MRARRVVPSLLSLAVVTTVVAAPLAAAAPAPTTSSATTMQSVRSERPCGWRAQPPRAYDHVVWVVLENHSFDQLIGPPGSFAAQQSPYLNSLATTCGLATRFRAVTHPSLPNYLAMVSGRTGGVTSSCTPAQCPQHRRTVFDQVRDSGRRWRVFAESMPSACRRTDAYPYVVRHNPPTYFPELRGCRRHDLPMGTTASGRFVDVLAEGRLPALTVVIPDQCHNTHDCAIEDGDRWLSELLPRVFDGPDYRAGRTAVVVTYDEGAGGFAGQSCRTSYDESCHIVTVVAAPSVGPGTMVSSRYDLYALLETTQRMLRLRPLLGHAADDRTRSMRPGFGI